MWRQDDSESSFDTTTLELDGNTSTWSPVHDAICASIYDEPQDLPTIVTSLLEARGRGLPPDQDFWCGQEDIVREVTSGLRALMQRGIVDSRYGLFLLTIEGRNLLSSVSNVAMSGDRPASNRK